MTETFRRVQYEVDNYKYHFRDRDCFKTWIDNINEGEKYVVNCSFRQTEGNRRVTKHYRTTVKNT